MAAHVYSEIYLHFTWHTDANFRCLTPEVEKFVHQFIANKCREIEGVYFHGVGGTEDHVHLAVRLEPSIAPRDLIFKIKGACTRGANEHFHKKVLAWQRGYGVVSFGHRQLKWVLDYIARQKEHHRMGTTHERLEAGDGAR